MARFENHGKNVTFNRKKSWSNQAGNWFNSRATAALESRAAPKINNPNP